jgi:serine/threonine-protein kinase RsbW
VRARVLQFDCYDDTDALTEFVMALARDASLPPSKVYWLRLAAEEITINIVRHGYRGPGRVWLTGGIKPDRVWLRIEDEAPRFDPTGYDPAPQLMRPLAEREGGGLGLLLALHKLDGFCYQHSGGKNRNELTMLRSAEDTDLNIADGVPHGVEERAGRR